jgi:hypothetical protein
MKAFYSLRILMLFLGTSTVLYPAQSAFQQTLSPQEFLHDLGMCAAVCVGAALVSCASVVTCLYCDDPCERACARCLSKNRITKRWLTGAYNSNQRMFQRRPACLELTCDACIAQPAVECVDRTRTGYKMLADCARSTAEKCKRRAPEPPAMDRAADENV